jgi:hypothetical protein
MCRIGAVFSAMVILRLQEIAVLPLSFKNWDVNPGTFPEALQFHRWTEMTGPWQERLQPRSALSP